MSVLSSIVDMYSYIMYFRDRRVDDWPLMNSPWPTIQIALAHYYVAKILGPRLMKDRPPFDLSAIFIAYNVVQMTINTFLFYEFAISGWLTGDFNWICQPVDVSNDLKANRTAAICWWFFMGKFFDLLETVFFVLKKKNIHALGPIVIHHSITLCCIWFGVRFTPGGHGTLLCLLNTFVHIWIFLYNILASLGPQYQKYLWWKKYLKKMLIAKFVTFSIHAFLPLFVDCGFPKLVAMVIGASGTFFALMFTNFQFDGNKAASKPSHCHQLVDEFNDKSS